ncbi:MAG: hypothetical protein QOE63_642 [Acidimicrobiaceae bacterium]
MIALLLVLGGVLFGHVAGAADGTVAASGGSGSSNHGGSSNGSGSNGSSNHGGSSNGSGSNGSSNNGTSNHGSSGTSGSHTSTTTGGSGGTAPPGTGGTTSEPGGTAPEPTAPNETTQPSGNGGTTTAPSTGSGHGVLTGPTVTSIVSGDNRAGGSTSDVDITVVDIDVNTGQRVTRVVPRTNQAPLATIAGLCILVVLVGIIAIAVSEANRQR